MGSAVSQWSATPFLDPRSLEPVYLQIAHALMRDIHRGRFGPGEALPGYRTLAERLGVSRNTVMAAYAELRREGWIISTPGEGSTVTKQVPIHLPAPVAAGDEPVQVTPQGGTAALALGEPVLELRSGVPDPRLVPSAALVRAYRRALTMGPGRGLAIDDPQGHPRLREALAQLLSRSRGIPTTPDQVLVTRGMRMALFLSAQALLTSGDVVAVEALGGRGAWEAFTRAGARCLPLPVDGDGLRVEELEPAIATGRLRAVLVTPRRQYPTLVALAPHRRARLLELAVAHRFAVLEVDPDSEFQFEGRPLAPLAAEAPPGVVVHVATLSKLFSPDLRFGFVHGPPSLLARMREVRAVFDRHGDPVLERAMAELMEEGELQRHLNRMVQVYLGRRDVLCAALSRELAPTAKVRPPSGGLALWVRVPEALDVDRWAARALECGVAFEPGRRFAFDGGPVAGLRIGFSSYAEQQLEKVAGRLRQALENGA
jgi:GntR family transcriptional regulator/MocR family aminotransferase